MAHPRLRTALLCTGLALAQPTEQRLKQALATRPNDAVAHSQYGIFLQQQGRPAEALPQLRAAFELNPKSAEHAYNLALAWLQVDRPAEALAVLDRGHFATADHLALRGNVLNALGRAPDAALALRRAVALDAGNPDTLYDLAVTLLKMEAGAQALPLLEEGRRRFPRVAKLHAACGMVAYLLGKDAEAVRAYEAAVKLEPDAADLYAALGDVRDSTGNLTAAEAAYRTSLRLDASAPAVHVKLGKNLAKLQRAKESEAAFAQAVKLEPANAEARFELGKLALTRGETAVAVEHLRQAVASAPGLKGAWYQLGIAYKRTGDEFQSLAAMEQFRKLP